jgi:hypothetical protein
VALLAEKLYLGLTELEAGVQHSEVCVAFGYARSLLILGGHLLAVGVAGLQLQMNNVEFLLCELLLETGDVGLRLEFGDAVAKAALAVERVDLGLLRVVEGAGSVGGGFLGPWRGEVCRRGPK